MDQEEIKTAASRALQSCIGFMADEVSSDREKAIKYYNQDKDGHEVEGRSQVVTSEVSDTILSIMPSLLKIFTQPGKGARFEPSKPEDEAFADQATDYINSVVMGVDNDAFTIGHHWFHDALLQKVGIVKWYWDETVTEEVAVHENLSENQFFALVNDGDIELLEYALEESEMGNLYTVKVRKEFKNGKAIVENVPPEEFLISPRARSLEEAPVVAHRTRKTISELIEAGFDREQVEELPDAINDLSTEDLARQIEGANNFRDTDDLSAKEVWISEVYMNLDVDDTGVGRLHRIWLGGDDGSELLDFEETDEVPFADICPLPVPHAFFGRSYADLTMPLQEISTSTMRGVLDSLVLANTPRTAAVEGQVNLDDLLTPRAGGVVRVKRQDALRELNTTFVGGQALPMFELLNAMKENRTGVSRNVNGISAEALQNTTATAASQVQAGATQRLDMTARIFANGVRKLYSGLLRLIVRHQDMPRTIKLRGNWVEFNPANWNPDMMVTTNVGLGYGSDEEKVMALRGVYDVQKEALMAGGVDGLVNPGNIYNTLIDLVETSKLTNGERYFNQPQPQQAKQPVPDPQMELLSKQLQVQTQIEAGKVQAKSQADAAKIQLDREKAMQDVQLKQAELNQAMAIAQAQIEADNQRTQSKINADFAETVKKINADQELKEYELAVEAEQRIAEAEAPEPVQAPEPVHAPPPPPQAPPVVNVKVANEAPVSGPKRVDIIRDDEGNIIGADVSGEASTSDEDFE